MENARDLNIPDSTSDINSEVIKNTYAKTTEYLSKNVCSFLWEKEKGNVENLTVGSWSTLVMHMVSQKAPWTVRPSIEKTHGGIWSHKWS